MTAPLIALDDFAGTGWGVACQRLGIEERGVEIMPEARASRDANGMRTVGADIWDHLAATAETPLAYDLLISSPPCQTFSMAGGGAGRRALDEVVGLIDARAYLDVEALHAFGREHDPRTALVLTPLVRVARDAPTYVVLEQVPPVLPVWERMAVELRRWGYSVVTGVLNAEQYGVPQTRRRAVLIARADGIEARMPTPTHSRYYSRDPKRLDPGVEPWVSMAEALGWAPAGADHGYVYRGDSGESLVTVLRRDEAKGTALVTVERSESLPVGSEVTVLLRRLFPGEPPAYLVGNQVPPGSARDDYHARKTDSPAQSMTSNAGSMQWSENGKRVMRSNYGSGGKAAVQREKDGGRWLVRSSFGKPKTHHADGSPAGGHHTFDPEAAPAHTVTGIVSGWKIEPRADGEGLRGPWGMTERPYPTIAPGTGGGGTDPMALGGSGARETVSRERERGAWLEPTWKVAEGDLSQPLEGSDRPTVSGAASGPEVWETRPATTVMGGSDVIAGPGWSDPKKGGVPRQGRPGSQRVTVGEAAALQSYPPGFTFAGTKTKQFLQVGNAVPPKLAEAILATLLERPADD